VDQLSSTEALEVGIVAILISTLLAFPVTIVLTFALIRRFRERVGRSMQAASGTLERLERVEQPTINRMRGELQIKRIGVTNEQARDGRALRIVSVARRRRWKLAAFLGLAACAYPLVLATVMAISAYKPGGQHPVAQFVLLYVSFFVIGATPAALAATMILTRQLRFLILAVLTLIVAFWGLGSILHGSDPVGLWLMIAGLPTGVVLVLNTRRVRAVGPIVFAATLFLFCTIVVGQSYGALFLWNVIGPVHFLREDLAQLPFPMATKRYLDETSNLPEAIATLLSQPMRVIRADHPERLTMGYKILFASISLMTLVIGAAIGWMFIRWLAVHYRTRRASDQMLTIDVLMAIFTFIAFLFFYPALGLTASLCAFGSFGGYKLFTYWRLRPPIGRAPSEKALNLLLLRVFESDQRIHALVERIMQGWRYFGSIRLIAGTDLVDSTIEPHEFFEFLSGRLSRAFVTDREDLEHRLSRHISEPDPDGLYRIEDFFCHLNTWQ
jgi:MFS family permease